VVLFVIPNNNKSVHHFWLKVQIQTNAHLQLAVNYKTDDLSIQFKRYRHHFQFKRRSLIVSRTSTVMTVGGELTQS